MSLWVDLSPHACNFSAGKQREEAEIGHKPPMVPLGCDNALPNASVPICRALGTDGFLAMHAPRGRLFMNRPTATLCSSLGSLARAQPTVRALGGPCMRGFYMNCEVGEAGRSLR